MHFPDSKRIRLDFLAFQTRRKNVTYNQNRLIPRFFGKNFRQDSGRIVIETVERLIKTKKRPIRLKTAQNPDFPQSSHRQFA